MVDIVVAVATKVAELLVEPVARQCRRQWGYVVSSDSYVSQLKKELEKLGDAKDQVQHSISEERKKMKPIKPQVEKWMKDVETITNKANNVLENDGRAQKTCFYGWLPNPKARYCLGKEATQAVEEIKGHILQSHFEEVSYENDPPGYVHSAPVNPPASDLGDAIIQSRASILKDIMNALDDEKHKVIGLYGPGGVGKTTLLDEVEKKLREKGTPFRWITKATVSRTQNLMQIQYNIAYAFGLNLKDEPSEEGRRHLLFKRLQMDPSEKVLIILDELWTKLDLKKIGIPLKDENMGCKLLLVSRSKDLLEQKMQADQTFLLEGLKEAEAFRLFEKMVGDKLKEDEELKAKAAQVVKKLAGLPLLITSVASTLKHSAVYRWNDMLIKIEDPNTERIVKWSYDHLESEDAKSLFRLCGLIGGTIKVELLLGLGMGLGLFQRLTVQNSRDRLNATLDSLRSICLLQDGGDDKENVTIHDLYSEVVVCTPNFGGENFLMMNSNYVLSSEEKPEDCRAICLTDDDRDWLAELMPCQFSNLKILMLSRAHGMGDCDRLDFKCMKELRVLYLSSMSITCLPPSVEILGNLRSLYLHNCSVKDVAILGKLKALQILSFAGSEISKLPKEIGKLTNLKSLNLSNCNKLKIIEPGVLKGLINLEELHMRGSFDRWIGEDEIQSKSCNASLAELKSLKKLTSLEISIPDPTILLKVGDLNRFWINIGNAEGRKFKGLKTMKLKLNGCDSILSREWVQKTLYKTQYLHLDGLRESRKNANELCTQGFPQLKHLDIRWSPSIKYIVSSSNGFPLTSFTILESLSLEYLDNLEKICNGLVEPQCFSKLKEVRVAKCKQLKYLWRPSHKQRSIPLEEIEVHCCDSMQAVVIDDARKDIAAADNRVELPGVRHPELPKLPNMTSFCAEAGITSEGALIQVVSADEEGRDEGTHDIIEFPLLKRLHIEHSPTEKFFSYSHVKKELVTATSDSQDDYLDSFFDRKVNLPSLEELTFQSVGSFKRIWHGVLLESSFCKLTTLTLNDCSCLLDIFPSTIIRRLHNLKRVSVSFCTSLKSLFDCGSLYSYTKQTTELLPQLVSIFVCGCDSLESLFDCGFLDSNTEQKFVLFPKLEELQVRNSSKLSHVCKSDSQTVLDFPSLKSVEVLGCSKLRYLFPYYTATTLRKLERLNVFYCEQMKEVVSKEEDGQSKEEVMSFPCLRYLTIWLCPNFGQFIPSPTSVERQLGETLEENDELSQPLFNEMATFPNLRELEIAGSLCKELWNNQISVDSFCKLDSLTLDCCDNLQRIATSHIWKRLRCCLEILDVKSCRSIEIIYESDGTDTKSGKLKSLCLSGLENLRHIWQYNGLPNIPFPNLRRIKAHSCPRLEILFPTFTAKFLGQINELEVKDCENMELIAGPGECEEATGTTITFFELNRLYLKDLPKFRSYLPEKYYVEFPLTTASCFR